MTPGLLNPTGLGILAFIAQLEMRAYLSPAGLTICFCFYSSMHVMTHWFTSISPRWAKGLTLAGLALVAISDGLTPLGFAHGTLYPILVIVSGLTRRQQWVVVTTAAGIVLTAVGFWLSPLALSGLAIYYVIANRLVSAVAIAITGGLTLTIIQHLSQVQRAQQALNDTYDTLQAQQRLLEIASQIGHMGGWMVQLPEGIVIWSKETALIHEVEPGFSPTVETAINFYAPEYRDRITEVFTACAEQGIPFDEELQLITAKEHRVWVRAIGQPVRDPQGHIIHVQGAFQNISAQKEAAVALELSEQRFRQLADAMPLIVWTAEPNGTVDYASHVLRQYTGIFEPQTHPSQDWINLLHPDDQEPCLAEWLKAVGTSSPYQFEFRLRRYDGDYRWHLAQAVPIRDQARQVVKWYGAVTEIHAQKQLEQESRALVNRFNTTLESITDAFFTLDRQWCFTFINRQAEQLLQRSRSSLLGKNVWNEFPEAVGSVSQQQYEKAVADDQSVEFREFYLPLHRWFDVRAYPSSEGLAVYFQDVSDRVALEAQLQQSQRLEAVGQLTGGIAHDFNNLLTVIIGNAELLGELNQGNASLHPLTEMIAAAARQGAELTQRLLAFARRQALAPETVNVNQLLASMESLLRRTLGDHIEIEMVLGAGLWPALIDPAQLESSLLNLCLNARDAMVAGGRLTVETANMHLNQDYADQHAEVAPGQYVMVAVTDTGTGISPENLERAFEPFFTTKEIGKGSGLGLSMVYGFVKQSGGHIKIYSEVGLGTTLRMYLPRIVGDPDPQPRPQGGSISRGSELILLVEDNDLVRRYAQDQLKYLGYRVLVANHGKAALDVIRQRHDIDLLFTDVVMPGMSGPELFDLARQIRPGLRVLYTSGYTENAIVHQGRLDPGVPLLSKPYSRATLSQKLRDALALSPQP